LGGADEKRGGGGGTRLFFPAILRKTGSSVEFDFKQQQRQSLLVSFAKEKREEVFVLLTYINLLAQK
jgi:hypothetical protein